ncbi:transglutaminaseTgpA domain-containing protein [Legionella waltersii]|uniref:Transglutaminase n=1 Tax=Legionella waltersii TaxID=66969 RepID=A0A0W1AMM0_9GAMM|nr:DUF3488 and transglutaminase-like domain-containing protein [Legionella waltersii]KTD82514.1 transglutaminase [Legionella waltersii]SNV02993.1 transglutaminase domain-containing protein [Legionella waltersii]
MNPQLSHQQLMIIIRHALMVLLICYLPHLFMAPWWIFLLVVLAVCYKLTADYFAYPLISKWVRIGLVFTCTVLLKVQYGSIVSSGFFIGFLLTFIALKVIETHTIRDIKVLILCNFYLVFASLIVIQELWIMIYVLVSVLANLSLMLKLCAPQASLNQLGTSSLKQVIIAVPLTFVLFYVFPRLASPLWQVPSLIQAKTGFSETMNPGSIGSLFDDDSIAFRVLFKDTPITNGYWKGLIFSFYNGTTWSPSSQVSSTFPLLKELINNESADYEVLMEPNQKKWLFYLDYPKYAYPKLLFSSDIGLVSQSKGFINQRFSYSIVTASEPIKPPTAQDLKLNTQLPKYLNPQIIQWAKENFAKTENDPNRFIAFLKDYIHHEEFWYTLNPPRVSNQSNQIDEFWFSSKKGFCEHYASAVTVILRSAGIPARVVVGYQGGEWNPFAKYLTIKQKNAHAWLEYWTNNQGWQRFDPTAYISPTRIDKQLLTNSAEQRTYLNVSTMSWWQRTKLMLESIHFFVERWFLFYNLDAQRDLLDNLGLSQWGFSQLLQMAAYSLVVFIILVAFLYWWQQRKCEDPLQTQYRLLKKELHRFHVYGLPSTTLKAACSQLQTNAPNLSAIIESFLNKYEDLRLCQSTGDQYKNTKETVALFKVFRRQLAHVKVKAKVSRKVI